MTRKAKAISAMSSALPVAASHVAIATAPAPSRRGPIEVGRPSGRRAGDAGGDVGEVGRHGSPRKVTSGSGAGSDDDRSALVKSAPPVDDRWEPSGRPPPPPYRPALRPAPTRRGRGLSRRSGKSRRTPRPPALRREAGVTEKWTAKVSSTAPTRHPDGRARPTHRGPSDVETWRRLELSSGSDSGQGDSDLTHIT